MCGGIVHKDSDGKLVLFKEGQVPLCNGKPLTAIFISGESPLSLKFRGFMRSGNLETYWSDRGEKILIPFEKFGERNTVAGKYNEMKLISTDRPGAIVAYKVRDGFRIVTEPARPPVSRYHHRMPIIEYL